ncbi:MAG: 23S rRNA (adenine(2503)-C(2))-methyltransferase RlmN [Parcubacteria group bacterium]|jgi:adenine C2-methylase RlmN of 23S rRNA A2503 and tRNA A37
MQLEKLKKILTDNGELKFRLSQIQKAIYQDGVSDFSEISTISKNLRETLEKEMKILSFEVEKVLVSKDKSSLKALLKLADGNKIESVLLSPMPARNATHSVAGGEKKWSVCISSQVGCPLNCSFCATGKGGLQRNLTAEEITDQVLFWRQYIRKQGTGNSEQEKNAPHPSDSVTWQNQNLLIKERGQISNIVYMGMGEPFLNWEEVKKSLRDLVDKNLFAFGSRSISVSTAGIPEGLKNLAEEFPQINLAISLHFATDEKRNRFMPINKKYNLEELKGALKDYFSKTNRQIFFEYVLLSGINDSEEDAYALSTYLKSIGHRQLLHVNLIAYNETGEEFKASSGNKTHLFKDFLEKGGMSVTIRKSLGQEVAGACGQLAGNKLKIF